jgi:hypothetical protein
LSALKQRREEDRKQSKILVSMVLSSLELVVLRVNALVLLLAFTDAVRNALIFFAQCAPVFVSVVGSIFGILLGLLLLHSRWSLVFVGRVLILVYSMGVAVARAAALMLVVEGPC